MSDDGLDTGWMQKALQMARIAADSGEVPVGAVLVRDGQLVAEGYNRPISSCDASAHAEVDVLRKAGQTLNNYRLPNTTLYVTIEPCTMCIGALIHARVARLVFGAREPRAGAVVSRVRLLDLDHYNHQIQWTEGILVEECRDLITTFFRRRRP